MAITWFDRLRAEGQGRTTPVGFTAPDGQKVFVLGGSGVSELAVLTDGDYTQVSQTVNLKDWDFVTADMRTIGQIVNQGQPLPGFPRELYDALWHYNFDVGDDIAHQLVADGFPLYNQGDIGNGTETYSPLATRCRRIPVYNLSAYLLGENDPQWVPTAELDVYTFQMWLNFDSVAHLFSNGIDPVLFKNVDGFLDGIEFGLSGAVGGGSHEWIMSVTHYNGGANTVVFPDYVFDSPNSGWVMLTFTWNESNAPSSRLKMYVDNNPVPYLPGTVMGVSPAKPAVGSDFIIGDPKLWGEFDEAWMLNLELTPPFIGQIYLASTEMPDPVDFNWTMQIRINGEVYGERVIRPGEYRRWTDFKAPVRHLTGDAEVVFRLTHSVKTEFMPG